VFSRGTANTVRVSLWCAIFSPIRGACTYAPLPLATPLNMSYVNIFNHFECYGQIEKSRVIVVAALYTVYVRCDPLRHRCAVSCTIWRQTRKMLTATVTSLLLMLLWQTKRPSCDAARSITYPRHMNDLSTVDILSFACRLPPCLLPAADWFPARNRGDPPSAVAVFRVPLVRLQRTCPRPEKYVNIVDAAAVVAAATWAATFTCGYLAMKGALADLRRRSSVATRSPPPSASIRMPEYRSVLARSLLAAAQHVRDRHKPWRWDGACGVCSGRVKRVRPAGDGRTPTAKTVDDHLFAPACTLDRRRRRRRRRWSTPLEIYSHQYCITGRRSRDSCRQRGNKLRSRSQLSSAASARALIKLSRAPFHVDYVDCLSTVQILHPFAPRLPSHRSLQFHFYRHQRCQPRSHDRPILHICSCR